MEVWGWEVWPPEDYDAIYKNAQSPTILHFPPPRPNIKNISKIYIVFTGLFVDDILSVYILYLKIRKFNDK